MNIGSFLSFHKQAFKNSLVFLSREKWATFMTVLVIGVTLMLSSIFWLFTNNITQLTADWQRSGHISLYLDIHTSAADAANVLNKVKETNGVSEARLETPEDGLTALQAQEGMQDIMRYLPENPLPTVIDVTPDSTMGNVADVETLYQALKVYPHVDEAKLDMDWVNRLYTFLHLLTQLVHLFMVMLAVAVILIIGNTLRLIIQERHEEIYVLKLIGASDKFILRPFLYSGIWYGCISALLAILLVNLFILSLDSGLNQLTNAYKIHVDVASLSFTQSLFLILTSSALGWLGAHFFVRRDIREC